MKILIDGTDFYRWNALYKAPFHSLPIDFKTLANTEEVPFEVRVWALTHLLGDLDPVSLNWFVWSLTRGFEDMTDDEGLYRDITDQANQMPRLPFKDRAQAAQAVVGMYVRIKDKFDGVPANVSYAIALVALVERIVDFSHTGRTST
jgi:hypothetical protein